MKGAIKRRRQEHNDRMSLAWNIARLNAYAPEKASKFPKLESLLIRERHPRQQSADEQLAIVQGWMAARKQR